MRRALTLVLLSGAVLAAQPRGRITSSSFLADVRYLASDEMGGRGNGDTLDEGSPFDGRNLTPAAAVSAKAREARERGARLLMVIEDPAHLEDRAMRGAWVDGPAKRSDGYARRPARTGPVGAGAAVPRPEPPGAIIDRTLTPQSPRLEGISVNYDDQRAQFTGPLRNVLGVLPGSERYVAQPAVPLGRTVAMICLDMIGRARGRVMVGVFGRAPMLSSITGHMRPWDAAVIAGLRAGRVRVGRVRCCFTGFHADYHRPSDDWPRIDAEGVAEIARLALRLVEELSRQNASAGR